MKHKALSSLPKFIHFLEKTFNILIMKSYVLRLLIPHKFSALLNVSPDIELLINFIKSTCDVCIICECVLWEKRHIATFAARGKQFDQPPHCVIHNQKYDVYLFF